VNNTSGVISALQTLNAAITGIASAPTAMPGALNTASLPIVLVFPQQGEWLFEAVGMGTLKRTYAVRVYVEPVGQGQGVDEAFQACLSLLDRFGDKYQATISLTVSGDTTCYVSNITDSGIDGRLLFAGIEYHGFEFKIQVTEKW
jgi:hypothetical protein